MSYNKTTAETTADIGLQFVQHPDMYHDKSMQEIRDLLRTRLGEKTVGHSVVKRLAEKYGIRIKSRNSGQVIDGSKFGAPVVFAICVESLIENLKDCIGLDDTDDSLKDNGLGDLLAAMRNRVAYKDILRVAAKVSNVDFAQRLIQEDEDDD